MFSRIQPSSQRDQGLVWYTRGGGRTRQGNGYTGRERERAGERQEKDTGKQIKGHVQGSTEEE